MVIDKIQIIKDTINNYKVISVPLKNASYKIIINQFPSETSIGEKILENSLTIIIALIAGLVALYQVKSNIVSTARIKWIETLKEDISNLYNYALSAVFFYSEYINETDNDIYLKYLEAHSKFYVLSNRIKMQLNIKETKHNDLNTILDEIDSMLDSSNKQLKNITQENVEEKLREIVIISRDIFKIEWEKSKKIFKI
ncbi:hypothetical protein [Flavobacterium sp. ov086]|uniref:hypothetical protein n=1 Tax=Flavobacterium sp. ov086 TaxID=1761785 RepID=UPI000B75B6D1|nr:hypothetical protein [Flavobacterium sp. ov086]SNR72463.1 hypothetical protein SAMN04487979_11867 [Flavobacterium sp. ov086]